MTEIYVDDVDWEATAKDLAQRLKAVEKLLDEAEQWEVFSGEGTGHVYPVEKVEDLIGDLREVVRGEV